MKSYQNSPLDFITTSRRMSYDVNVRMNYMPHTGRKLAHWRKTKQHVLNVVKALTVAKAVDLHQIWLMVQEDKIPPVFGPIAVDFHQALKRDRGLGEILIGDGDKMVLWHYNDDAKFEFVPAYVPRGNRSAVSQLGIQFPKFQLPPELEKLMS